MRTIAATVLGTISILIVSLFIAVAFDRPIKGPRITTIIIHDDGGGLVGDYLKFYKMIRAAGVHIRVEGACISACTLLLSLPPDSVCMLPGAKLGFHLATYDGKPDRDLTAELSARFYPEAVQRWIERRGPLREAPIYMTGEEAVSLGIVQPCSA